MSRIDGSCWFEFWRARVLVPFVVVTLVFDGLWGFSASFTGFLVAGLVFACHLRLDSVEFVCYAIWYRSRFFFFFFSRPKICKTMARLGVVGTITLYLSVIPGSEAGFRGGESKGAENTLTTFCWTSERQIEFKELNSQFEFRNYSNHVLARTSWKESSRSKLRIVRMGNYLQTDTRSPIIYNVGEWTTGHQADETCKSNGQTRPILTYSVNFLAWAEAR